METLSRRLTPPTRGLDSMKVGRRSRVACRDDVRCRSRTQQGVRSPSHLTHWLFEGFQPLQNAVVGSTLKLSIKNLAAEMAQRGDEREQFLKSHCVFLLWLGQRTAEVRHRLFDSESNQLRQHFADAKVSRITVNDKWFREVGVGKSNYNFKRGFEKIVLNEYLHSADQ